MRTIILKPGFLVGLKTELDDCVRYDRRDLAAPTDGTNGAQVTEWITTKVVADPAEHDRATEARNKARAEIVRVCIWSKAFGCLCPLDREADLAAAVARAQAIVQAHNESPETKCTRIAVNVLKAKIGTDEESLRSIASEVRGLLAEMDREITNMDEKAIRKVVSRAQRMAALLDDSQVKLIADAVTEARKAARTITARVTKKGEDVAAVLADIQRGAIEKARFAFMDLDETPAVEAPAVDVARFADLECEAPAVESTETSATETTGEAPSGEEVAASA